MADEDDKHKMVEQLEAQAVAMDADLEELGIVKKSEYEQTQEEIEELRTENEDLESEMEDLQDEVSVVEGLYAEELAEVKNMDAKFFEEKCGLGELRDMYEEEFDSVDEITGGNPNPKSGDNTDGGGGGREELSDEEKERIEDLQEKKATYEEIGWESNVEAMEEQLAELKGE